MHVACCCRCGNATRCGNAVKEAGPSLHPLGPASFYAFQQLAAVRAGRLKNMSGACS